MKNVKKLLAAAMFAFALLLAMPAVLPGYSHTTEVSAATVKNRTLIKGQALQVKVTNAPKAVSWTTSNSAVASVAKVNNTTAKITAKAKGTAIITGTSGSSKVQYRITVETPAISKTSVYLLKGYSTTLKVNGTSQKVTWKSSKTSVATVNASGKVVAKAKGTATITATVGGTKNYTCKVTVETPAISKTSVSIVKGNSTTLKITGTTRKVTWKSSNTSIATVTSAGKVTAKKAGTATITATVGGVKNLTCKVTVKNPATVSSNFNTLKNTISKSSKVSNGNRYIQRKTTATNHNYIYSIIYDKKNDRLQFVFSDKNTKNGTKSTISMYMKNPNSATTVTPNITINATNGTFKTKATIDRRYYTGNTDVTFSLTSSSVKVTTSIKKSVNSLSNSYLELAFKGWDTLLQNQAKLSLAKIGFTTYK